MINERCVFACLPDGVSEGCCWEFRCRSRDIPLQSTPRDRVSPRREMDTGLGELAIGVPRCPSRR